MPAGAAELGAALGVAEKPDDGVGERARFVGLQKVHARLDPEAFGANRGRDDRASHGERFEDLESRAAAGTQRHHIHRAFRD